MTRQTITPELIRSALQHVSANLPRDQWSRVGMAIKSEFPDGIGCDLFTEWSASAEGYDLKATKSTWQSIKAGGGVGIGTLFHLAKENGYTFPESDQAPNKPDPETVARLASERAASQQADQARQKSAHDQAASEAALLWQAASDTGTSPYLIRKGVQPYGVRIASDGWVLVPLIDASGKLWNVQRIAPAKPASGGTDKLFLKGGRKSGLWHWCGDPAGAAALLICEGYATAASVHQATGRPVAVAFDAGNLAHVAKALHQAHPAALIVICGDDDLQTFADKGFNPGRDKAMTAARAVQGLAVFPEGLPAGASDFNDMATAAGIDAVRLVIDCEIDTYEPPQKPVHAVQANKAGKRKQPDRDDASEPLNSFDRFKVDGEGVWYYPPDSDNGPGGRRRVCGSLRVTGLARDAQDAGAALLLEFDTPFGKGRRWLMPLTMLAGDGAAYRSALLDQGFSCPTDGNRRRWLTEYLQSRTPDELVRHVSRVGWHGRCYVLPRETLGDSGGDRLIFHSEAGIEANFSQRGTLDRWQADIARLCVGNSRLAFAVAVSFAGPVLAWVPTVGGGGFHYTGISSIGKTTGLLAAASVWGKGAENDQSAYIQKWRATGNGLEFVAEQHSDGTLILDEMGQIDANEAGSVCYMLADGAGKARAKAGGGLRHKPTWRILFLSSGEVSLEQHMESVGKKMKGGQGVRLITIPTEISPSTTLETNHEFIAGHELSGWVKERAARTYGTAGRAWLEWLTANTDALVTSLRESVDRIEAAMVPESAGGQVKRGGRRFALVAAAGELATRAGLTGWPEGEATRAATVCFDAWIDSRGGSGSSELTSMLRQFVRFMQAHGEGRFASMERLAKEDDRTPKTLNQVGFRRREKSVDPLDEAAPREYFIFLESFRTEICQGFDYKTLCRSLIDLGCMVAESGRLDVKARLPGMGLVRCYQVTSKVFELDV